MSLLWNVAIFAEFGIFFFGFTEIGVILGSIGGILSIVRVKYSITMSLCAVAGLFLALRAALRFGAPYSPLLIIGFVLGLVALMLVERNRVAYGT